MLPTQPDGSREILQRGMGENAISFFYLAVIFLAAAEMYREV